MFFPMPWVVFPLPEHPQPHSLQCYSQPAAVPFKKQCQLSRNCSTNLKASCVFCYPSTPVVQPRSGWLMGQNWQQVLAELG